MKSCKHAMLNVLRMLKQHGTDISHIKCTARKAAMVFVFAAFIACAATPAMASGLMKITDIQGGGGASEVTRADPSDPSSSVISVTAADNAKTVYFGNYWQNGTGSNLSDYTKSGVKWRVLANNTTPGDGSTGVFLLSDQALFADKFYNSTTDGKQWREADGSNSSKIRKDLTGVMGGSENSAVAAPNKTIINDDGTVTWGSFAGDAFDSREYAAIAETTHTGGNVDNTQSTDKLFILSMEEAMNTDYGFTDNEEAIDKRIAAPTKLAENVQMYNSDTESSQDTAFWWLRSPEENSSSAYCVIETGRVGISIVDFPARSARPALNLDQSQILFLSAAKDGKNAAACNGAFGLDNTYTGANGWKVTLKDTTINTHTVTKADVVTTDWNVNTLAAEAAKGDKQLNIVGSEQVGTEDLVVSYSGATTGNNKYVSALLCDSTGNNMLNYAKVASTKDTDSGTDVKVNLSKTYINGIKGTAPGTYQVKFFGEEANGDYLTDYASNFNTKSITAVGAKVITTLSSEYANSGLTANLSDKAQLGFESGKYDTNVSVAADETGTIIADAANGTTLTGDIFIGNKAELTAQNKFAFEGNITLINGTLKCDDLTIGGNIEAKGNGDYNVNGTTKISGNFVPKNNLNFNLHGEEKGKGYTFIDSDTTVDLSDATADIIRKEYSRTLNMQAATLTVAAEEEQKLVKGDTMTLVSKAKNYNGDAILEERGWGSQINYKHIYGVGIDQTSALKLEYLGLGAANQTKSFSEARLAGSAALNSGSDLIAGQAIDNAASGNSWEAFAAMSAAHSRYETGSHITLNSYNIAAGVSKKISNSVTLGIFAEVGNGTYSTVNEYKDGNVNADGDINYYGGGILAKAEGKKTTIGQLYAEASVRAGHIKTEYDSDTYHPLGSHTNFDTSGSYIGAHAGIGYKWSMKDGADIDTYIKYLWNRQNGDTPTIHGDKFDLNDINSHRLRAGLRYNSKPNSDDLKFFAGLAYEHEFDGTAKGTMGEYTILEPDFKGGSARAELGIKYDKKESPWKVELGLTGYAGKRESIGANLNISYEFGGEKQKADPEPTAETETTKAE